MNPNQIKLKVNETPEKDEKITINFKLFNVEEFANDANLDTKTSNLDTKVPEVIGRISYFEKE